MVDSRTLAYTLLEIVKKPDAEKHTEAFITYLKEHNLLGLLPQIVAHIERRASQDKEEDTLHITSRYELDPTVVEDIQKIAGAENAAVKKHVSDSVIGGFSATYNGYIYDGSVQTQLQKLRNMLTR